MAQQVCTSETGDRKISGLASVTGDGGGKPGRDVRALQLENDTMRLPGGSRRGLNINSHPYEYKKNKSFPLIVLRDAQRR